MYKVFWSFYRKRFHANEIFYEVEINYARSEWSLIKDLYRAISKVDRRIHHDSFCSVKSQYGVDQIKTSIEFIAANSRHVLQFNLHTARYNFSSPAGMSRCIRKKKMI